MAWLLLRTPNLRNLIVNLWSPPGLLDLTALPQHAWSLRHAGSTNPSVALWRAPPPHSCGHLALHCRPSSDGDMILTLEGNNFGLRPLMDELQVSASDAGSGYVRRTHPLRLQDETDLNLLHAISVRHIL